LAQVAEREKDIRFSSRTRLNTTNALARHALAQAARELIGRLPRALADDADVRALAAASCEPALTLVHVIYRRKPYETQSSDYEFSRLSMLEHWRAGRDDVTRTVDAPPWQGRTPPLDGVQVFDLVPQPARALQKQPA
jgi:NTE family protein